MKTFRVRFTPEAEDDILRLYDFLAEKDVQTAERALAAIDAAADFLSLSPYTCRKATTGDPVLREMVIPFGSLGYVALFEIELPSTVTVCAVRHQREDDYH